MAEMGVAVKAVLFPRSNIVFHCRTISWGGARRREGIVRREMSIWNPNDIVHVS